MDSNLTNLLPEERLLALRRQYFYRLGALAAMMAIGVVVVHGILLYATHIYLLGEIKNRQAELAGVTTTISSSEGAALDARLTALTNEANILTKLPQNQSPTKLIAAVLALPHPGVRIVRFGYQPAGKGPATLVIAGTASTRDTLRAFDAALTSASFVKSVDLPVSSYANASNISFTITLSLSSTPFQ